MSVWIDWRSWRCAVCGWAAQQEGTSRDTEATTRTRIRAHLQTHDPAHDTTTVTRVVDVDA